ncbi:hypothetical protein KPH14_006073 [Odynerus spinipes]|uniref:Complementary sex determination N-terminal domain-containing protein n=1 Tax=Odynerus spinipes TaxID=1348599 RepID=A0AAD9RJM9_9HYME|nr:hypothetical protein KPH14_006073 [Odynerus spinipes]
MKKNILGQGSHDERRTTSRKDDRSSLPHSRSEEERRRRRQEWLMQQEREREHERLKRQKILEYELKRAREQGARHISGRSADHSRSKSKSRSRSLEDQHRRDTKATSSKPLVMSEKLETKCGATNLFKGPEGTKISTLELRRIKVDIHRNISVEGKINELQRDIVNPEDLTIIRRRGYSSLRTTLDHEGTINFVRTLNVNGEGSKPIFEREEIKGTSTEVKEVEEHRTVIALDNGGSAKKTDTFKRRSPSSPSSRNRSRSPRPSTSRRSRSRDSQSASCKFDRHSSRKSDRRRSRGKSRESEKKYKERRSSRDTESLPREHKDHRRDTRSSRLDHRDSRRRGNESRNEHESRTMDHSADSRERKRGRSRSGSRSRFRYRERQVIPSHCIEQVPYPIYYGPRPIMVGPVMPIRGQVPIARGRLPHSMMGPMRPFPPRFIPSDIYGLRPPPPPNYRFGSMF